MQKTFPMQKGKGGVGCLLIIGIGFFCLLYFAFLMLFPSYREEQYIWGFRDIHGKVVISPKFDSVKPFAHGLAPVWKENQGWGYIDKSGAIVIDLQFDEAGPFTADNLAWVIGKGQSSLKWRERDVSFIDRDGNVVFSVEGIEAYNFYDGVAIVKKFIGIKTSGTAHVKSSSQNIYSYGLIDKKGKFLVPHIEDIEDPQRIGRANQFKEGLVVISREAGAGYMNTKGEVVINCQFKNAYSFSEGLAAVRGKEENARWAFIDKKGKVRLSELAPETYFDPISDFNDGLALVKIIQRNSSGRMYIKKNGKPAFSTKGMRAKGMRAKGMEFIGNYSAGLVGITIEEDGHLGKVGFVNKDGETVIEPAFLDVGDFHTRGGKVAWAIPWTPYGFWDAIDDLVFGFLSIYEKQTELQKYGYIDRKGDWLIQPETPFVERIRVGKVGSQVGKDRSKRVGTSHKTYNFSEGLAAFPSLRIVKEASQP